jgi:hypothetical protein
MRQLEMKVLTKKDSFFEELDRVFNQLYVYQATFLLMDSEEKVDREQIFSTIAGNEGMQENSHDNITSRNMLSIIHIFHIAIVTV